MTDITNDEEPYDRETFQELYEMMYERNEGYEIIILDEEDVSSR